MIIIYHNQSKVTNVVSAEAIDFSTFKNRNVVAVLLDLADKFEDELLVWCHQRLADNLNVNSIENLFHHKKLLFSFNPSSSDYFGRELGYIEDSPFIKINKEVRYATWQMSSQVGAIHASALKACQPYLKPENDLDYFLHSLAKRAIVHGLLCYSEPKLLRGKTAEMPLKTTSLYTLFKFTKQHYRTRWIFLLFFNLVLFEKRFPLLPLLFSLFYKKRTFNPIRLNQIPLNSTKTTVEKGTIDVLIPTIGRKQYLLDVLKNLAAQTHLPTNVVIIEQNPIADSVSELDFIQNTAWPFTIKHRFTHQAGACNARNMGLELITSEFCFMADDDIVFGNDLLEKALDTFRSTGNEVFLVACHLKTQTIERQAPKQFTVFGAGHAFVKSTCLQGLRFNMGYEFGFGEDNDFGMQLRQKGFDILYISSSNILHLKAPMGGFRTKPILRWQHEVIQPKPSPTVMLFRLLYDTPEQLRSYKTTIFFKNLNKSFLKNPLGYIKLFKKKWNTSVFWAITLKHE
ncbi:glycosyltransferase family 2 protein [Flavobacterium sp. J49]|uniref:glycosyltransferase family 2 protein n=1 Tax=Flavobacterium sp. J49 TaxID=2718534 RepID=UPI0015945F50|nr:glycosyltransferase family A protein [Flavobacterium sp. J49]MBF6639980.1 glycosyltransferase family 2 protein [Flavobacterium sp. J49]NIC01225.1 glycosyltransferase family 2 protein [Flavobacterium sp. J49]